MVEMARLMSSDACVIEPALAPARFISDSISSSLTT
jgi:hypothetical protein